MALHWLDRWPLVRQLRTGADGTGPEAMSARTRAFSAAGSVVAPHSPGAASESTRPPAPRTVGASVARSVCPYCGVGCGQLVYHRHGKLLAIEGDPESPINEGTLCPKGAASYQLLTHRHRLTRVLYRAPYAAAWTALELDAAMDMVAERVWESRRRTFVTEVDGEPVNHTTALAHLGGATLDNEENYLIKKLFTAGLGMVAVSNQARI